MYGPRGCMVWGYDLKWRRGYGPRWGVWSQEEGGMVQEGDMVQEGIWSAGATVYLPPPQYSHLAVATEAGGMHPTGMHSCY